MAFLDETGLAELWSLTKAHADTKARVASGSYSGSGTYGSSNPTSVTLPFKPKIFMIPNHKTSSGKAAGALLKGEVYGASGSPMIVVDALPTDGSWSSSALDSGGALGWCTRAKYDNATNTLSWYSTDSASHQNNASGYTYYWIAIG